MKFLKENHIFPLILMVTVTVINCCFYHTLIPGLPPPSLQELRRSGWPWALLHSVLLESCGRYLAAHKRSVMGGGGGGRSLCLSLTLAQDRFLVCVVLL